MIRMTDSHIAGQLLYGKLTQGSRKQGRPNLRFKDTLKRTSAGAVSVHLNLRPLLQTDQRGDPSPHEQQLPLKRTGFSVLLLQETDVTGAVSASTRTTDYRCGICGRQCFQLWTEKSHVLSSLRAQTVIVGHR